MCLELEGPWTPRIYHAWMSRQTFVHCTHSPVWTPGQKTITLPLRFYLEPLLIFCTCSRLGGWSLRDSCQVFWSGLSSVLGWSIGYHHSVHRKLIFTRFHPHLVIWKAFRIRCEPCAFTLEDWLHAGRTDYACSYLCGKRWLRLWHRWFLHG